MIKIEVTGNSIGEVADKLLAIGASLQNTITVYDTPARKTPPKKAEVMPEVAEAAPVDPTPVPKSAPVAAVSESQPTTTEPSSTPAAPAEEITPKPAEIVGNTPAAPAEEITPAPAASASEDEELEVVDLPIATLDIETDVRPLILSVVEKRGKPVMEELLSRFGVAKASQIEPALLPELVALMQEALTK
jgi:hypothetical protein